MSCATCGVRLQPQTGRGRPAKYCSGKCRNKAMNRGRSYEYKRKLACAGCSKPIFKGPGSRPQGEARCRACYKLELAARPPLPGPSGCTDCGIPSHGDRCRPCHFAYRQACAEVAEPSKKRERARRRYYLDKAAPGLNSWEQRLPLLLRWQRQGKGCAYCPGPAETVDHVIPLIRGGTNYEGNLSPCCLDCNVRKSDRLPIEWRLSRQAASNRVAVVVVVPPKATPKVKPIGGVALTFAVCTVCAALHTRRAKTCSPSCSTQVNRDRARNRYRISQGIPTDAPLYGRAA